MKLLIVLALFGAGCAHAGTAPTAPPPSIASVREGLQAHRVQVQAFTCELRLTYFGSQGRLRGTASLAARRPNQLRYDLQGPHGGVLLAVASDGNRLQALDFKASKSAEGPATAENFDRMLQLVPLGLDAGGWVGLLFGEVAIPDSATVGYDSGWHDYALTWQTGQQQVSVLIDPQSHMLHQARIRAADGTVVSQVEVQGRDDRGLPASIHLSSPPEHTEVDVRLRDVAYDPDLPANAFVLQVPAGFQPAS